MGLPALLFADSVRIVSWFSINVWLDSSGEFEFDGSKEESCLREATSMAIQSSARNCLTTERSSSRFYARTRIAETRYFLAVTTSWILNDRVTTILQ